MEAVALCWRRDIDPSEVARLVLREPDQRGSLAAVAADRDAPLPVRMAAVAALVEAQAVGDLEVPGELAEALDDLALVDAAVTSGRGATICAALHALRGRIGVTSLRRVVRRLVVAGLTGLPIAGLSLEIGDLATGSSLAVRDFTADVSPGLHRIAPDPDVATWIRWVLGRPPAAARAVLHALGDQVTPLLVHASPTERARISGILATP